MTKESIGGAGGKYVTEAVGTRIMASVRSRVKNDLQSVDL